VGRFRIVVCQGWNLIQALNHKHFSGSGVTLSDRDLPRILLTAGGTRAA
jgi:hypothetical protein